MIENNLETIIESVTGEPYDSKTYDLEVLFRTVLTGAYHANEGCFTVLLDKCESPIERTLLLQILARFCTCNSIVYPEGVRFFPQKPVSQIFIAPQWPLERYRADILVAVKYADSMRQAIIEADGHQFHEKTVQQAKRDKRRDRELLLNDIATLRFTGSEIFNDPEACVLDVLTWITKALREMTNSDELIF